MGLRVYSLIKMINSKDLECATFLYNVMYQDLSYLEDLQEVEKSLNTEHLGKAVVSFLNHWRMRLPRKTVPEEINKWYKGETIKRLEELPSSLLELDFNDAQTIENITTLFTSLDGLTRINDTGFSKILHIIKPGLFVMWDNEIRKHYLKDFQGKKNKAGSKAYLFFIQRMREIAIPICKENENIASDLSMKLKRLYEGNLRNHTEEREKSKLTDKINFLERKGKSITKILDEYNWIVITPDGFILPSEVLYPIILRNRSRVSQLRNIRYSDFTEILNTHSWIKYKNSISDLTDKL